MMCSIASMGSWKTTPSRSRACPRPPPSRPGSAQHQLRLPAPFVALGVEQVHLGPAGLVTMTGTGRQGGSTLPDRVEQGVVRVAVSVTTRTGLRARSTSQALFGAGFDQTVLFLGAVDARHGQVDDRGQDGAEEDDAGDEGPQAQATFGLRRGEEVTDVRAQRAGQDVGQPEAQHRSGAELPGHEDSGDQARRQQDRDTRAPAGQLQGPVADRRPGQR